MVRLIVEYLSITWRIEFRTRICQVIFSLMIRTIIIVFKKMNKKKKKKKKERGRKVNGWNTVKNGLRCGPLSSTTASGFLIDSWVLHDSTIFELIIFKY